MNRTTLLDELFINQDNCLFTAEAHHQAASACRRKAALYKTLPAIFAAIMGAIAANGIASEILVTLAAIGASVSAVANILNPDRDHQAHLGAAKAFTVLKHDSRFLRDCYHLCLSDDNFCEAVKNLHSRYNDLVHMMPPTNDKAFEKARQKIHSGRHEPSQKSGDKQQE